MKTWKDVYVLPLKKSDISWVYDSADNFVFQFVSPNENLRGDVLDCINGKKKPNGNIPAFVYKNGFIETESGSKLLLIRGWGNLTGIGAMNLSHEDATNIQDTFAQFIIDRLKP